ncbi:hypothetical protein A5893_07555 [Pedobacter psychrophilus]|uniref:Alginate lyase domain-containing protein n=1 Tax=Pedobacter psychrophilus TaxID=1826909 RepID=A0A179DIS9_9SPHI|nr:alginate lyase family protein [Pedobacter psychrophilus]OAQ40784.1 hypothetical protein A5893_07555 [Pedobacter psychrophilus]
MKQSKKAIRLIITVLLPALCVIGCIKSSDKSINNANPQNADKSLSIASSGAFVHPGILNTKESLDFIRTEANNPNSDRFSWYSSTLVAYVDNSSMPTSFPSIVYAKAAGTTPTEIQIRENAILAYAYALRWAKTGSSQYATNAKFILDGWASNFQKYLPASGTSVSQAYLEASWVAPSFAAAAEIIKHYTVNGNTANWPTANQAQFVSFLNILKNNYINKVVGSGHQQNWAISAGYAKMAIGVYFDNRSVYDSGVQIIQDSIVSVIDSNGNMPELCSRGDCGHFQFSLTGLTYAAEIDRIQGNNEVFTNRTERLMKGFTFMQQAFKDQNPCDSCSKERVYPSVELAHRYYANATTGYLRGLQDPYGATIDNTFLGFTTYTHRLVPLQ